MATVMWFRRDLRLDDNPALATAVREAEDNRVVPLFVLDPRLWRSAGRPRQAYLNASLTDLGGRVGGLQLRRGNPVDEVVATTRAAKATVVYVAEDFGPYGRQRDVDVERALARHDITLARVGSPYVVPPGQVRNKAGAPYQVFTAYARAWAELPVPAPERTPRQVTWLRPLQSHDLYHAPRPENARLPAAGEPAAGERWAAFLEKGLADYAGARNRADLDLTSRMSVHLKWGEIHPRTMLRDLARRHGKDAATYRSQLVWREFFADVLARRPDTARDYLRPGFASMEYDDPGDLFDAWCDGHTGFPIVDAGMRQLRSEGWMHNRVRMIVASFLVKDLHVEWQHGARHFMRCLVDADLASNQHGWQWTAGCGTDAAPYFRIFNPTLQGKRFDPHGDYVRRYVPELRALDADSIHEPWRAEGGSPDDYPRPVVDHGEERREALRRFEEIR